MSRALTSDDLDGVVELLLAGSPVVLPTDTVYGLCAAPGVEGAVDRLFDLKGRSARAPVAVLCTDTGQALSLAAAPVTAAVRSVAATCWPGPLTLVLARRAGLDWDLGGSGTTIGLRCPDHDLLRAVTERTGPVAATSANLHGRPTATTLEGILEDLGELAHVDGGRLGRVASTVVDATGEPWRILREGAVSAEDLRAAGAPAG